MILQEDVILHPAHVFIRICLELTKRHECAMLQNENRKLSLAVSAVEIGPQQNYCVILLSSFEQEDETKQSHTEYDITKSAANIERTEKNNQMFLFCCIMHCSVASADSNDTVHVHLGSHSQSCNTIEIKWTEIYLTNSKCVYALRSVLSMQQQQQFD